MYTLSCDISISNTAGQVLRLTWCEEVKIKSAWRNLTDTCEIALPKNVTLPDGKAWSDLVKRGDTVVVKLGYNGQLNTEFEGYVARVGSGVPLMLFCEDEMYQLKRKTITKSYANAQLQQVIRDIAPGYTVKYTDPTIRLGKFTIKEATPAKVLRFIADNYGVFSYFRGKVLQVGFPYQFTPQGVTYSYLIQQNVADHSLTFLQAEDRAVTIKAISHLKDGKARTVFFPDKESNTSTVQINFTELSEAELRKQAEAEYNRYQYDGYKGSLTGFGLPFVRNTEAVDIIDRNNPDNRGRYLVDEIEVRFGASGFRRIVELGRKIS